MVHGDQPGHFLGNGIATVDADNDGQDDLAVTAHGAEGRGFVYLFSGAELTR